MGAVLRYRVTGQTKDLAHAAAQTKEIIELRDRSGVIHRGRVVSDRVEYEFGLDAGWYVWFEIEGDFTTQDVIAKILTLRQESK
jgi:hypothetical protein